MGLPKGLQAGSTKEVAWQGLRRPGQQADSPVARQETQGHDEDLREPLVRRLVAGSRVVAWALVADPGSCLSGSGRPGC